MGEETCVYLGVIGRPAPESVIRNRFSAGPNGPAVWTSSTPSNTVRSSNIRFCSEAEGLDDSARALTHKRQDKLGADAGGPGAGRAKLRLSRGFPRRTRLRCHPSNHSFESSTICADSGIVRHKMRDAKIQPLLGPP
jgi:hypothetical protein